MMASNSALGLSVWVAILSQNLRVVCVSPRNDSRPQGPVAQSEKGRVTRLRCGILQGRYTTEGSYFSRDY